MGDILFLAHRTPFPPDRGDRIRSWNLLRYLALRRPVHLVAFGDGAPVPPELSAICASVRLVPHRIGQAAAVSRSLWSGQPASVEFFKDPNFQAAVDDALNRSAIRTIYAFSSQMAAYLPPQSDARILIDFVDMDSQKFDALAGISHFPTSIAWKREARLLRAFERTAARRADICLFVSASEAIDFEEAHRGSAGRIAIVPNGVDLSYFRPLSPATGSRDLLFVGQMDYRPNVDAVAGFARDVMPILRHHNLGAQLKIVGRAPTAAVRALAKADDIDVVGEVANVRPWLQQAAVVVVPLRVARGIQNKVLEAMACARPVVASSAAVAGLHLTHGHEVMIADTPNDQARAVGQLLKHPERAAELGAAARQRVEQGFSWAASYAALEPLISASITSEAA